MRLLGRCSDSDSERAPDREIWDAAAAAAAATTLLLGMTGLGIYRVNLGEAG